MNSLDEYLHDAEHAHGHLCAGQILGVRMAMLGLERLGIAFWDSETTLQWAYNADEYFHAASTMKLAVLLGVYRQVGRGELTLDAPVHVRNKFRSVVNDQLYMLDFDRDADPDLYRNLGRTILQRCGYPLPDDVHHVDERGLGKQPGRPSRGFCLRKQLDVAVIG